jgi:hypothetical protein
VIILGVPYSEYKVRVGQRHGHSQFISSRFTELYMNWVDDLNKNEIPYKFVEASGDYKILEEEEFYRMLND